MHQEAFDMPVAHFYIFSQNIWANWHHKKLQLRKVPLRLTMAKSLFKRHVMNNKKEQQKQQEQEQEK